MTRQRQLLRQPVSNTCLECHDGESPDFAAKHLGLPAESLDCASCHDPHASATAGMMLPKLHPPFADGDCTTATPRSPRPEVRR